MKGVCWKREDNSRVNIIDNTNSEKGKYITLSFNGYSDFYPLSIHGYQDKFKISSKLKIKSHLIELKEMKWDWMKSEFKKKNFKTDFFFLVYEFNCKFEEKSSKGN